MRQTKMRKIKDKDFSSPKSVSERNENCLLEQLYRDNYALMLNYGLKINHDIELVEDCIQDIFVKLSVKIPLQTIKNPRVYLLKSLRHAMYNKLHSLSERAKDTTLIDNFFYIVDSDDLFDTMFPDTDQRLFLRNRLKEALVQLSTRQKHAIYLRYVKNLSHKEVAEILEINVQSSLNLTGRSLVKIRKFLKDDNLLLFVLLFHLLYKLK